MIKIYYKRFSHEILLLEKICIINLLIKKYMRTVRLRNIITRKNLHNKITDKNLYDQLFSKISVTIFIYCQCINIFIVKT
jgi:hypothetical protein